MMARIAASSGLVLLVLMGTAGAVPFADPGLEGAVRAALSQPTGELTTSQLLSMTTLQARGRGIADLRGLEQLTGLVTIDLADNQIADLTPLAALVQVELLNLENNRITDLRPLASLGSLESLILSFNQVIDLSPLLALPALGSLEVLGNPLGLEAIAVQVPALEARGVEVLCDAVPSGDGETAPTTAWEHLGPKEEVGVELGVSAVAVAPSDPAMIYAMTENGLWRSQDEGATWSPTGVMTRMGDVFVDPVDAGVIYLNTLSGGLWGTGQDLKSADGGTTWTPIEPDGQLIAADPVRSGRLYAANALAEPSAEALSGYDYSCGFTISDDGGRTWREVGQVQGFLLSAFVQVHPADPDLIYVGGTGRDAGGNPALSALFVSEDGGATWSPRQLAGRMAAIAPDPRHRNALYAVDRSGSYHSSDQGRSWESRGRAPVLGWHRLTVHPRNPDWLWVRPKSGSATWQSRNGGSSWEKFVSAQVVVAPHPSDPDRALMAEVTYGSGRLYQTRDTGRTWNQIAMEKRWMPVLDVAFDRQGLLYASSWRRLGPSSYPVLLKSDDLGSRWLEQSLHQLTGDRLDLLQACPTDDRVLFAHAPLSGFLRSEDGGATWTRLALSAISASSSGAREELVAGAGEPLVYYALDKGDARVYRSTDLGMSWQALATGLVRAVAVNPADGNLVFVAGLSGTQVRFDPLQWSLTIMTGLSENDLRRSRDGGQHWEALGQVSGEEQVLRLAMHPLDADRLYAATGQGLYLSTDQGETWERLLAAELSDSWAAAIRFDPTDPAVICYLTGRHLYYTAVRGRNWTDLLAEAAAPAWVTDAEIDPVDPRYLVAAMPQGVYRCLLPTVQTAVAPSAEGRLPRHLALRQNYPNPFNASTLVPYALDSGGPMELAVFDLLGRRMRVLLHGTAKAGEGAVRWDGRDDGGRAVASGVYLAVLDGAGQRQTRRMLLLR